MTLTSSIPRTRLASLAACLAIAAFPVAAAQLHHVQIIAASPTEAVSWYTRHLDCATVPDRGDTARCNGVDLIFAGLPTMGSSQGTGANHLGFAYPDVTAKMAELEAVGVRGSGVRLQRFDDGSTVRVGPDGRRHSYLFDPWGTRIELVEEAGSTGLNHVHLSATDPEATLEWYRSVLGGEPGQVAGENGIRFGDHWVFALRHSGGVPAPTRERSISQLGFSIDDLKAATGAMERAGADFEGAPSKPANGRTDALWALVRAPDSVTVAVVEPTYAGILSERESESSEQTSEPYETPRTPWGEPDLQGVWSGNAAHGIPLERPEDLMDTDSLTAEQAAARRERGTLRSIWGYEREWRDTSLGYDKIKPSTQVAMIVDPPNGRLPPMTEEGKRRAATAARERERIASRPPVGPEDLTPYVRCITRGLPGMMFSGIYNNGLQIVQGPGTVVVLKEMVHEARAIPTQPREHVGEGLTSWLGDSVGRWEGDALVVETQRFNGRSPYRGSSDQMKLTERFKRIGPTQLAYSFTMEDPLTWQEPWTATFAFDLDDGQYELVEYACHEGNYGMFNILSGARARDRQAQEETQ